MHEPARPAERELGRVGGTHSSSSPPGMRRAICLKLRGSPTHCLGRSVSIRDNDFPMWSGIMKMTGGCLCGSVRWESSGPPIVTRVCWCRECQYLGAGSGTVNACFRTSEFTVTGNTSDYLGVADSGNKMHRRFCPVCGTPLFSEAEVRPPLIFVRVGTFDDPNLANPEVSIWTSSAPRWACINAELPQVDKQAPPAN